MKQTALKTLLAIGTVSVVAFSTAFAQTTREATTTTTAGGALSSSSTTTSTSSLDGTGTITTYSPGSDYISMRTETATEPVRYYYSKDVAVVDPAGATVDRALLRSDMPVRYSYVREGD